MKTWKDVAWQQRACMCEAIQYLRDSPTGELPSQKSERNALVIKAMMAIDNGLSVIAGPVDMPALDEPPGSLHPCPFCGSTPRLSENAMDDPAWALAHIICDKCGATSKRAFRTTEAAVTWWNKRI